MTYSLEALLGMVIVASIIVLFMKHGFTALMKRINALPANVLALTRFILPVLLYDMLYCYHAMYRTRSQKAYTSVAETGDRRQGDIIISAEYKEGEPSSPPLPNAGESHFFCRSY